MDKTIVLHITGLIFVAISFTKTYLAVNLIENQRHENDCFLNVIKDRLTFND